MGYAEGCMPAERRLVTTAVALGVGSWRRAAVSCRRGRSLPARRRSEQRLRRSPPRARSRGVIQFHEVTSPWVVSIVEEPVRCAAAKHRQRRRIGCVVAPSRFVSSVSRSEVTSSRCAFPSERRRLECVAPLEFGPLVRHSHPGSAVPGRRGAGAEGSVLPVLRPTRS